MKKILVFAMLVVVVACFRTHRLPTPALLK